MHFLLGIGMFTTMVFMLTYSHRTPTVCGLTGDLIIHGVGIDLGIMEVGIRHIGMVTIGG
jgi:hypothetical protein